MSIAGDVRHVVLVVFDTLRRDAVGSYGTAPPWAAGESADPTSLSTPIATPHLDAFARESVRFTRAYPEALPTLWPMILGSSRNSSTCIFRNVCVP